MMMNDVGQGLWTTGLFELCLDVLDNSRPGVIGRYFPVIISPEGCTGAADRICK
jgi:hypothetical protein